MLHPSVKNRRVYNVTIESIFGNYEYTLSGYTKKALYQKGRELIKGRGVTYFSIVGKGFYFSGVPELMFVNGKVQEWN